MLQPRPARREPRDSRIAQVRCASGATADRGDGSVVGLGQRQAVLWRWLLGRAAVEADRTGLVGIVCYQALG